LKGVDKRSDLAVVKINANDLPVAILGNSDNLRIGQWVMALGNPFGFALRNHEPTVTAGVVSALHRSLGVTPSSEGNYNDLIQTDAAINPGNSGGPLANLKGEVVGINVAIFSTSGGYEGVGFAIPVNVAKRVINRLVEGKKIVYGWLGVIAQDVNVDLAKQFSLPDTKGILVASVIDSGPAGKAGIQTGDIIRKINNEPVENGRDLTNIVEKLEVGRSVDVLIFHQGKDKTVPVQITERPEATTDLAAAKSQKSSDIWQGLHVEDITPDIAQQYGVAQQSGVVVSGVDPESAADDAGLNVGDVIVEINKERVYNLKDYQRITSTAKGDTLVQTLRGFSVIKGS
jgi:serine protease Do